ncbi:MAG: glutamate 5-kinase [Nitrospirae bacterium]|nr:glutamate 5-kinase [Nitrospirota bacterium]
MTSRKDILKGCKKVVLKIGSNIISSVREGLDYQRIEELAREISSLKGTGREVIIVSSGAVVSGIKKLGLKSRPASIPIKQAAAAVGQSRLMWAWESAFEQFNETVAQVLLTGDDMTNRTRLLNSRNTISTLLEYNVIPVINENDTVATEEIRLGDNDNLAGLVANLTDANLLIILSDVYGLFTEDPRSNHQARLIPLVSHVTPDIERMAGDAASKEGTGGMRTKIQAAKRVSASGAYTIIICGLDPKNLSRLFAGEEIGTIFLPEERPLKGRKHWITYTLRPKGKLVLDDGAVQALRDKGKSLLPSGIVSINGSFAVGDPVCCYNSKGAEIAKGLVNFTSSDLSRIKGVRTSEIEKILGYKDYDEVIHRDNLVLINPGQKDLR